MPEKKKDKATLQIIFSSILLAVILFVELYAMINVPDQFIVIGVVGILFIACLYVLIQGIIHRLDMKKQEEKEHYDSIIKSQKASYLLMKKYFGKIEEKLDLLERTTKVPTEEIVGMQKGIGKVIISRSRENAEAMLASNEILVDRIDKYEEKIKGTNDSIVALYKNIGDEHLNQLMMKQQDIIMNLKDMELRLNTAIMQSQKVVAAAPQIVTAPMQTPTPAPAVVQTPVDPVAQQIPEAVVPEFSVPEPEPAPVSAEEPAPVSEPEAAPEPAEEPASAPEPEEKPPMPDLSDPNKVMSPDDIAALLANMGADDAPAEEPAPAPEPEEKPPMPDLSDPNKVMSPDDIAALLANMGADDAPAEEPAPAPMPEEKPPMPDLTDPNRVMSPDDIAALLADMGVDDTPEEEPAPEPAAAAPEIDLSDPNKKLSEDDIAALFASMGN